MLKENLTAYIKGTLVNTGEEKGHFFKISIPCYDDAGNELGNAQTEDTVDNVEVNGKWEFKAAFMGTKLEKCDVEQAKVLGLKKRKLYNLRIFLQFLFLYVFKNFFQIKQSGYDHSEIIFKFITFSTF